MPAKKSERAEHVLEVQDDVKERGQLSQRRSSVRVTMTVLIRVLIQVLTRLLMIFACFSLTTSPVLRALSLKWSESKAIQLTV